LTTNQAQQDSSAGDFIGRAPALPAAPKSVPVTRGPAIVTFGNGKGGTGKSTAAMHVIVGLLREGCRVGAVDLDAQQGTLTRYFDNRRTYAARHGITLAQPLYRTIGRSDHYDRRDAASEESERLVRAIDGLSGCDVIVIDTPGSSDHLSREGHFHADLLITPVNDSFVDLDLFGQVDPTTFRFQSMGPYAELVWEQNNRRLDHGKGALRWLVMRNRVAPLNSRNGRNMDRALAELSEGLGLRLVPGFSERVIFRELFLNGLTLLDLRDQATKDRLTMSHMAALQEMRTLLREISASLPTTRLSLPQLDNSLATASAA